MPAVTIAVLPSGTTVSELASLSPRLAVGTMNAGFGSVRADQTFLDISQGNRLTESLYPDKLGPLEIPPSGGRIAGWQQAVERADGAPAQIYPGLLGGTLADAGIPVGTALPARAGALVAARPDGTVSPRPHCAAGRCPGLTAVQVDLAGLRRIIDRARPDDLVIAIERPSGDADPVSAAIVGRGFAGVLSSPSTRLEGFVLSTDIAPTVLDVFGVPVPDGVDGELLSSIPSANRAAPAELEARLVEVTPRRGPVLGVNAWIWALLAVAACVVGRGRGARLIFPLLATGVALVPALLLFTAAIEPSLLVERLIVGVGGLLLAGALLALASGPVRLPPARARFAAFAAAATLSVVATGVDMLFGSPLTALSVLGPSPALRRPLLRHRQRARGDDRRPAATRRRGGRRLPLGPADPRRAVAITAAVTTVLAVAVFAPGRFGADVGAAITFPAAAVGVALGCARGSAAGAWRC